MAIKIVFEDNENTPSSVLLKSCYYGSNIFFSAGVSNLLNKAISIKQDDDTILMFYDLSPNNIKTVKGYNNLIGILRQNKEKYKNMYVIPIICIEYHICRMYDILDLFYVKHKDAQELIDKIVKKFDWADIDASIKAVDYIKDSLEHAYKFILNKQSMRCLVNRFKYDSTGNTRIVNSIDGILYEKDCTCDRKYCKVNVNYSLEFKSERLYTLLPVFVVETDKHREILYKLSITFNSHSIKDARKERQEFYNMVCNNMGINKVKIYL